MDSATGELQPQLEQAQQVLAQALDKACASDLDEIDTGELIRIEETLDLASKAAKEAVSLRLVRRKRRADQKASAAMEDAIAQHRVFDDYRGTRWQVFAVFPSEATAGKSALPPTFREGWLAFKSETELRRVAPVPANWIDLSIEDLRELCHRAYAAPKRASADRPGGNDPQS
ncbi:MAG: hypothetical protein ACRENU_10455 [Gemmatimonadaceae bacterium]